MWDKFVNAFVAFQAIGIVVSIIYRWPLTAIPIVGLIFWFKWEDGRKERDLKRRGFHVEYVSPGRLRDGADDCEFVYYTLEGEVCFEGKAVRRGSILKVPSANLWEVKAPSWAAGHLELILDRICRAYPHTQLDRENPINIV